MRGPSQPEPSCYKRDRLQNHVCSSSAAETTWRPIERQKAADWSDFFPAVISLFLWFNSCLSSLLLHSTESTHKYNAHPQRKALP